MRGHVSQVPEWRLLCGWRRDRSQRGQGQASASASWRTPTVVCAGTRNRRVGVPVSKYGHRDRAYWSGVIEEGLQLPPFPYPHTRFARRQRGQSSLEATALSFFQSLREQLGSVEVEGKVSGAAEGGSIRLVSPT